MKKRKASPTATPELLELNRETLRTITGGDEVPYMTWYQTVTTQLPKPTPNPTVTLSATPNSLGSCVWFLCF